VKRALFVLLLVLQAAAVATAAPQSHITSPEESFGFKPGADRKLADWTQVTGYLQKLASESDRVRYAEVGKTTEGRPFVAVTISSADNIAHLSEYQEIQRRLADPRITTPEEAKALIARGKTVVVVTCNIHSTEIASSQSATEFAYRLATGNTPEILSILHNTIIVLVPSLNPDGQQLVVDWYKKYLGTPYEGTNPVVLWHHYVGHDDNRDWASFTQVETRLAVEKVINPWHPQILYDLHQMGATGPRIYLPPFVDPIDPNLDPILISSINALGVNTALEISQTGKQGVLVDGVYDLWSPERNYIVYHNGLRVLTESASVNIATPINIPFSALDRGIGYDAKVSAWNFPNPWKGGEWHLSDIVNYQLDAFFSIVSNAATYRERYLTNFYQVGVNAVNRKSGPYAYVIPADQADRATTARLINTLRIAAVEVQQASADFDADGKHYAKGSYIVQLKQPYGSFAKTLLEIQHYPDIREYPGGPPQRPYDVTAQTLPLLFGVNAVEVQEKFTAPGKNVQRIEPASGHFEKSASAPGYLIPDTTNSSLYALFSLLKDNVKAYRLTSGTSDPGTIYVPKQDGIDAKLAVIAEKFPVDIAPAQSVPAGNALAVALPRIALYKSWVPSMDEGWTRFIFDQNGIPYTSIVDDDVRKGDLNSRFDVIVLPDNSPLAITSGRGGREEGGGGEGVAPPPTPPEFTGGLGPSGVASLDAFAQAGGTIVTLNKASQVYAKKNSPGVSNAIDSVDRKDFYVPGSILQVSVDTSNPIAFGSTPTVPVWFELGPSFNVSGDARSIATYTADNPLLSGWILGGQHLKGTAAIAEEPEGKGRIILFGIRPQYRAQSEVAYKFFFNALLYSSSTAEPVGASSSDQGAQHIAPKSSTAPSSASTNARPARNSDALRTESLAESVHGR
jgi:hypothetical protein